MKLTLLIAVLTTTSFGSALACDSTALEGTWSRSIPDGSGQANAGKTTRFTFTDGALETVLQLTDSSGPYFERETTFAVSLDERGCVLTGSASYYTDRSIGGYDEPGPQEKVDVIQEKQNVRYQITLSSDGKKATFDNGTDAPFSLTKEL